MKDMVYILSKGSSWDNNELRYSLRSIEKNLSGFGAIHLVGHKPDFITNVNHIQHEDDNKLTHEKRIRVKLQEVINSRDISEDFLFFNDDHFLLSSFDADKFPYYADSTLDKLNYQFKGGVYKKAIQNTIEHLETNSLRTINFDTHCPILYNKTELKRVLDEYAWTKREGLLIKSLYCNTVKVEPTECEDVKLNKYEMTESEIMEATKEKPWFSIGHNMNTDELQKVMSELYPNPSKYECR